MTTRHRDELPQARLSYPIPESLLPDRRKAWAHLSELFLDTEIDRQFLARALAELSFSVEELNEICIFEVAPLLYSNLEAVAGEWAGFDLHWMEREILKSMNAAGWRERAWRQRSRTLRVAGNDWKEIQIMIEEIRERSLRRSV